MAGIADYVPTLGQAPADPGADQRNREALIQAMQRQAGDYSPIQSPWQGAARLASGLMSGLLTAKQNHDALVGQQQGARDLATLIAPLQKPTQQQSNLANAVAPTTANPPPPQTVTPLPPPLPAPSGGGGGAPGIGGIASALKGMSPIGPSTSAPLQAVAPLESATPPAMSVGPTPIPPLQPSAAPAVAPVPAPTPAPTPTPTPVGVPVSEYPSGAPGGLGPEFFNGQGGPVTPAPSVLPQTMNAPLPVARPQVADVGVPPTALPIPRPEENVPIPPGRPEVIPPIPPTRPETLPLVAQAGAGVPLPVERPQIATPPAQMAGANFFAPGGGFDQYRKTTAQIESGGGTVPDRPGSKFHGTYQLGPGWGGTGTEEQRFLHGTQDNFNTLSAALGRDPTQGELYLAHQQGAGGALKLINNPDTPAGELVPPQNISQNAGNPNAPASAFVNKWASRYGPTENAQLAQAVGGGSPGLITPGQRQLAQAVAGTGGIYPQTASQGNPAIGAMPLPARAAISNSPFMQPQSQQTIAPPVAPPVAPPKDLGPQTGLETPNQFAQNLYGQPYSDLPLIASQNIASPPPAAAPAAQAQKAGEEEAIGQTVAPAGTTAKAAADTSLPPIPDRPRINTQAAMNYLANPLYPAASKQFVLQLLQKQIAEDQAGTYRVVTGPGGYPVQQNTATSEAKAYPGNPEKENQPASIKEFEYGQTHPDFARAPKWVPNLTVDDMGRPVGGWVTPPNPGQPQAQQHAAPTQADIEKEVGTPDNTPPPLGLPMPTLQLPPDAQARLNAIPQARRGMVEMILDNRMAMPRVTSRGGLPALLAQDVANVSPGFDAAGQPARAKARSEFLSGGPNSYAKQIEFGNTAINHLADMPDLSEKIPDYSTGALSSIIGGPTAQQIGNYASSKTNAGMTAINTYQGKIGAFAGELTKYLTGAEGSLTDRQAIAARLDPSLPSEARKAAIADYVRTIEGRKSEIQASWHNAVGPNVSDFPVISPAAQKSLDKIRAWAEGPAPGAVPAASPAQAVPAIKPGGTYNYGPTGNRLPQ